MSIFCNIFYDNFFFYPNFIPKKHLVLHLRNDYYIMITTNNPARWRSVKKCIAFLLVMMLVFPPFLASCGGVAATDGVLDDYFVCLSNKNFAGAHEYLWKYGSTISKKQYVEYYQNVMTSLGVTDIALKERSLVEEGDVSFLAYTLIYKTKTIGDIQTSCRIRIIDDGELHLEYDPSMLLEGYDNGDRITLISLPGRRGEMFTADHVLIAANSYAETVYIDAKVSLDITATLSRLSEVLSLSDAELTAAKKKYDTAVKNNYAASIVKVYGKGTLSDSLYEKLTAIEGVGVDTDSMTPQRYYPYGKVFSHITGYTVAPNKKEAAALAEKGFVNAREIGMAGLEKAYDEILQGKDGYRVQLSSASGQYKSTVCEKAPVHGQDLILSIDSKAQQKAYYLMASGVKKDQTGASIVLNAKTGFVEAMVSSPSYDPNLFVRGISKADYDALMDEASGAPLNFRATSGRYPPGSLLKPFSVTPSLEKGIITKNSVFPYTVENNQWIPPNEPWGWPPVTRNEEPDGPLNLDMAMKHSDNIYFSWVALKLGEKDFLAYMKKIGLGEAIPFDIPTAKSNLLNKDTQMDRKLLTDMSFGQGEILVTPIQIASLYTAFQNGGDALAPKLVAEIKQGEGQEYVITQAMQTEIYKADIMTDQTINTLIPALKDVVSVGTGHSIQIEGLTLAAKTGTALKGKEKTERTSWIVAWWQDMEESRLALVLIDGPRHDSNGKLREEKKFGIARELLKP